ncbi:hypothetical protein FA95DRAFT_1570883 [Auriscalpium vulgare]|uniref:Uncharacterized protein n=1 Tax=Auriscalpium vulgare TaxID=40419 RepID=A0ACB8S1A4_9AGAM|nr:hypothetical protein FA95DRAFT_1570883 [Auriscalpium vulgare]
MSSVTRPLTKGDKLVIQKREKKQKRDADRARREAGRERIAQAKALYMDRMSRKSDRLYQRRSSAGTWRGGAFGAKNVYTPDDTEFYAGPDEVVMQIAAFELLERARPTARPPHEIPLVDIMRPAKKRGGRRHEGALLTNGQTFEVIDEDAFSVASLEDDESEVDGWEVLSALSG